MALNEIIIVTEDEDTKLIVVMIPLNRDKNIYLLKVYEVDITLNKKFIRNKLILVNNQILTTCFSDTIHLIEELNMFEIGNNQNKYLDITEYKNTKNLKLKHSGTENIFISRSEARAICRIFNYSFSGYSISTVLENEFKFTPQLLTKTLHANGLL